MHFYLGKIAYLYQLFSFNCQNSPSTLSFQRGNVETCRKENVTLQKIIIPGREFILCTCDVEGSLALDPPQNKSESRLLFRAYGKLANNVWVNLGLD